MILRCSEACVLDWDKHCTLMIEIWLGLSFSFLTAGWYNPSLLDECIGFGRCGCIPFNALQLACFAKNFESIKRLIRLGADVDFFKITIVRSSTLTIRELRERRVQLTFPHIDPNYARVLRHIIRQESYMRMHPCEYSLVKKRSFQGEPDSAELIVKCFQTILTYSSKYTPMCVPVLQRFCSCNAFIHAVREFGFTPDIYLLFMKVPSLFPTFKIMIGVNLSDITPSVHVNPGKPLILVLIYHNKDMRRYHYCFIMLYAHSSFSDRFVISDSVRETGFVKDDLNSLVNSDKMSRVTKFLEIANPWPAKRFITEDEDGQDLLTNLRNVHTYFTPDADLFSHCKNNINRNLLPPYRSSLKALPLPDAFKASLQLE